MPRASARWLIVLWLLCSSPGCPGLAEDSSNTSSIDANWQVQSTDVRQALALLKDAMSNISPYLGITISALPQRCLQVQCRFKCFNGRHDEIAVDITEAMDKTGNYCDTLETLQLYNYEFPNAIIPVGFLGPYGDRVEIIELGISNVSAVAPGAFGNGIFHTIHFEELQLEVIDRTFFTNISSQFRRLSIEQHNVPLLSVYPDFLENVKFQIEILELKVGITCVRNLTATEPVLSSLAEVDFSFNNFSNELLADTFSKLTMVERLVLAHSQIEQLPRYIFQNMDYLVYLDISHNNLITLSKTIFGFQNPSYDLHISADGNAWHCDCELQQQMKQIFVYHSPSPELYCASPAEFANISVFEEIMCTNTVETTAPVFPTITESIDPTSRPPTHLPTAIDTTTPAPVYSTTPAPTSSTSTSKTRTPLPPIYTSTTAHVTSTPVTTTAVTSSSPMPPSEIVTLECSTATSPVPAKGYQNIEWPRLNFFATTHAALSVKVTLEPEVGAELDVTFGLFWFSRTSIDFTLMEQQPEEYGLGCYFTMPLQAIVKDLVPDISYTFCLVDVQQSVVSPLSCKSLHVGGNLDSYYNAWISHSMRTKGISLMVLGVVLFLFLGILAVFLVLKQKPIWLKGSKRVMTPKGSSGEIVVFPRGNTAEQLRRREAMLLRSKTHRAFPCISRQNSLESLASTDSYMTANIYEVIPAYITFDGAPQAPAPTQPGFETYDWHLPSLQSEGSIRYAQITPRTKRISSDPLPALPLVHASISPPQLGRISDASGDYVMPLSSERRSTTVTIP